MPNLRPRYLESTLTKALSTFPVVVLTGARQTGKTTLAKIVGERQERRYITLDDLESLERARREPDALVQSAPKLTLDEVQRHPDLLLAVKRAVDEDRTPGRFLLTGSANFLLLRDISETLAGRAVYLDLWTMSRREQLGLGQTGPWQELLSHPSSEWIDVLSSAPEPNEGWRDLAQRGGYPVPVTTLDDTEGRAFWLDGYIQTYLERDLRQLSNVASLVDFRRFMRAVCLRLGSLINQSELGRDVGLAQPTIRRYLSLLETSYQVVPLPAYSVNRTKRLIKTPKLYWADTALALRLAGERDPRGAHLENLILNDFQVWRGAQIDGPQMLYWRTAGGEEVDLVVEDANRLLPIEIKSGHRPSVGDTRGLRAFMKEYPNRCQGGLLAHGGDELGWIAEGVLATPWWRLL